MMYVTGEGLSESEWNWVLEFLYTQVKKQKQKIQMILDGKKIEYETVDVAASEEDKKKIRQISGNDKALPSQICNGDTYCGVRDWGWDVSC